MPLARAHSLLRLEKIAGFSAVFPLGSGLLKEKNALSSRGIADFPDDGLCGPEGVPDGEGSGFDLFFAVVFSRFTGGETGERNGEREERQEFPLGLLRIVIRRHDRYS